MNRRVLFVAALVMAGLSISAALAAPAPAKEETVTLVITGMT